MRQLKKTRWGALSGHWVTHDVRDEVVDYVGKWSGRAELPAKQLVRWIGVGMSKFHEWRAYLYTSVLGFLPEPVLIKDWPEEIPQLQAA